jgi:hypothetical protein
MRRMCSLLLVLAAIAAVGPAAWSQDVSTKKDIAVFNLGYYRWTIPPGALGSIDEQIRGVFVNLGRFTVIGMTYSLDDEDIGSFIDSIRRFKTETTEIPEQVQMGREFFTQEDMNRLVNSFIVVIPTVADFITDRTKDGKFTTEIRTSFTFVNVETQQSFAQFFVTTNGSGDSPARATREAVDEIPGRLTFEIRKVPEFQLRTGILEVNGPQGACGADVLIEFGSDMGVKPGDEYLIMGTRVLRSGKQLSEEKGLLIVRRVKEQVSTARVLYANPAPQEGDQLQELPRAGTDLSAYFRSIVWQPFGPPASALPTLLGLRVALSRGFFAFRPFVSVELPLHLLGSVSWASTYGGIPLNASLGGEYNLYLGRLQIVPSASLGFGGSIPLQEGKTFQFTHLGGAAGVAATWLFSRDWKVGIEAGYTGWGSSVLLTYEGVYAGAGVSGKF